MILLYPGSIVVEDSTHEPKLKDSNPATGTWRMKIMENKFVFNRFLTTVSDSLSNLDCLAMFGSNNCKQVCSLYWVEPLEKLHTTSNLARKMFD